MTSPPSPLAPLGHVVRRGDDGRGRRPRRRLLRVLSVLAVALAVVVAAAALAVVLLLRGSLPRLDGERELTGLTAAVTVTRDTLGVPDIRAASREDAARALGYLHGQDRFFQMDLQRRRAAGELAALLGPALLEADRDTRRHRFGARADTVLAAAAAADRALLAAYAAGVNAGLADLRVRPFEYLALRRQPEPWRPADTILTLHAMCLDLSLDTAAAEAVWAAVRDRSSPALTALLLPRANPWNAPLQEQAVPGIAIPDSTACDVRTWDFDGEPYARARARLLDAAASGAEERPPAGAASGERSGPTRHDTAGSNSWAVSAARTADGRAIVANDMHLALGLPGIWYRARLSWPEGDGRRTLVGVTLPGAPLLVTGSNGRLAWGFTNSMGDWVDLVILETDPDQPGRYRTPAGWRRFASRTEVIEVAGAEPDTLTIDETIWGPVWRQDVRGRPLALRWTAHDAAAVNLGLRRLETADDVEAAVSLAPGIGIPPQNLVCADAHGRIAWTIAGRIPRRVGWDGRLPVSWADGACRWDGYLEPAAQPRRLDPPDGLLWTANNRVTAGADLVLIGDGGYALGARARQIRDGLRAMDRGAEGEHLALQLDDRALMLARWRDLALAVLDRRLAPTDSLRHEFATILRDRWSGRAEPASAAYRLVRGFAFHCVDDLYHLLTHRALADQPDLRSSWLPYRHAVTWAVLQERPPHLLPPWSHDWDHFVLQAVDRTCAIAAADGRDLAAFVWGDHNRVHVAHPFVQLDARLQRWLAAPEQPLPGDSFMPRVQHRRSGASERMVVSPGHERDGILHLPGGPSGHPWSPYFLAGHADWATGEPTPLVPGPERHRLVLRPEN